MSGIRQSEKDRLDVTEARIEVCREYRKTKIRGCLSPQGNREPSSVRAQTTATSATEPFVIHVFSPFRTQPSPVAPSLVSMPAGFDPNPGSVRPKHPIAVPLESR